MSNRRAYRCKECGREFSRPELVTRHERSHLEEKPFVCQEPRCNRGFARSDSLLRHSRLVHNAPFGKSRTWKQRTVGDSPSQTVHDTVPEQTESPKRSTRTRNPPRTKSAHSAYKENDSGDEDNDDENAASELKEVDENDKDLDNESDDEDDLKFTGRRTAPRGPSMPTLAMRKRKASGPIATAQQNDLKKSRSGSPYSPESTSASSPGDHTALNSGKPLGIVSFPRARTITSFASHELKHDLQHQHLQQQKYHYGYGASGEHPPYGYYPHHVLNNMHRNPAIIKYPPPPGPPNGYVQNGYRAQQVYPPPPGPPDNVAILPPLNRSAMSDSYLPVNNGFHPLAYPHRGAGSPPLATAVSEGSAYPLPPLGSGLNVGHIQPVSSRSSLSSSHSPHSSVSVPTAITSPPDSYKESMARSNSNTSSISNGSFPPESILQEGKKIKLEEPQPHDKDQDWLTVEILSQMKTGVPADNLPTRVDSSQLALAQAISRAGTPSGGPIPSMNLDASQSRAQHWRPKPVVRTLSDEASSTYPQLLTSQSMSRPLVRAYPVGHYTSPVPEPLAAIPPGKQSHAWTKEPPMMQVGVPPVDVGLNRVPSGGHPVMGGIDVIPSAWPSTVRPMEATQTREHGFTGA